MERLSSKDYKDRAGLAVVLEDVQDSDRDALICFDYGKLWGTSNQGGHVCVFDYIDGDAVHMVDPEHDVPKYRTTTVSNLFEAMDFHGGHNSAGVWRLTPSQFR